MQDLYRDVVLERYRRPRHRGPLEGATTEAHTNNPLCGDELSVFVRVQNGALVDVTFEARGCSISQASADLMIDVVRGRSMEEAATLIDSFRGLLIGDETQWAPDLGDAQVLQAVRKYPVRVKCALLAWETLGEALRAATGASP